MSRRQRGGLRPGPALVAVVTVAVVMAGAGPRPVQGQETDRPDPTWQLRTLDGERFALGDLRGRPVFVNVWASWCPPCVAELGSIDRLARAVGDEVAFLLVSPEDERAVRDFLRRRPLEIAPVLEETPAPEALGVQALPHTAILDATGHLVLGHRGAAEWDRPEVVALLRSLIEPERPQPVFTVQAAREGHPWTLEVEVPVGWQLHAAAFDSVRGALESPYGLGLPLAASWGSEGGVKHEAELSGPRPIAIPTEAGLLEVYEGRVRLDLSSPPDGSDRLELRWALCRAEICVPGRTDVAVDQLLPRRPRRLPLSARPLRATASAIVSIALRWVRSRT